MAAGTLAAVTGTLRLGVIDGREDDPSASCKLDIKEMLWDTGSQSCSITADLLPAFFLERLRYPSNDQYRDESGNIVQVEGYIPLSNSEFYFESIFTVVSRNKVPNGRSGVILGQKFFIDHMNFRMVPPVILESHWEEVKENEWGDLEIIEWMDAVTGKTMTFC